MNKKLNLSNLQNIFVESINRNESTLAFEINNGKGRFLFMMFFDNEDQTTKDQLFLFMKNSRIMLTLKMYGNHFKGEFYVYIKPSIVELFKQELEIDNADSKNSFILENFFANLNLSIPANLSLGQKIDTLKSSWNDVKNELPKDIIDESEKIFLIGPRQLPKERKPQEKTLRKLYFYGEGNPIEIAKLIEKLKKINSTVAWTNDENYKGKTVLSILKKI
ncbi:hypothetical protein [Flavobacterium sp. ZB4P13]|uniref:hypothetical protein n=1 Tax=Flavobacterium sp. ZB4P13 TaxID=3401728 RepID=UPI003AAFFBA0